MKTLKRFLKWTFIVLFLLIGALLAAIFTRQHRTFEAPFPVNIVSSPDSAVIARGAYLAYGAAHCGSCHVPQDQLERIAAGERIPLSGGLEFKLPIGSISAPNLTPDEETGIGRLSDAELARALRYSVGHDGRALFGFMPFQHLSDDDLVAVISFLRSQPAVKHEVPKAQMNLLGKAIRAFMLEPEFPTEKIEQHVEPDTTAAYGAYLANNVGNCRGCHTSRDPMTGAYIGEPFAGGMKMESDDGSGSYCVTPNLTPDAKTGRIYGWSQENFVNRFRMPRVVKASHMPWELFAKMTDNDLKAIYKYLNSLKPVQNETGPTFVDAVVAKNEVN
jgi:mono/diheme cytochrome c family protein